jgi:2-polyprenyl-3-methyl-5-hydroxy-6-metoxy-1,4-benzoquinol methylase
MKRKEYEKIVAPRARKNEILQIRDLKAIEMLEGNLILDVGCGTGILAKYIEKNKKMKVIGIDFSPKALEKARESGVECYEIDIEKGLPKRWRNKFDSILMSEVLEHIFDTDFVIDELKKVLRPEGILVLTVPNACRITYRGLMLFGYAPRCIEYRARGEEVGHIRAFDIHRIKKLLIDHKFRIEKIVGSEINFVLFKTQCFTTLFPNLADSLIVKARKVIK